MEYREFGKTGFKTSLIGMGTYFDPLWIMLALVFRVRRHAKRSVEALKFGLDSGINLVDTAEVYQTEPLVAEAIQGRKRDELFVASKVSWPFHMRYDAVLKACEKSLRRLQTNYIDLYQVHFPSGRVPFKETMSAMEKLVEQGKVRHIGISNFSLAEMQEAESAMSKYELASTQMNYSLAHREIEKDILPHCESQKIALLAYYPLGHGKLAGEKMRSKQTYREISSKHGEKTPAQVALNWFSTRSNVVFPIPRGSNAKHVEEDLDAVGWKLDELDMALLGKDFPA